MIDLTLVRAGCVCAAALALAGCAGSVVEDEAAGTTGASSSGTVSSSGGTSGGTVSSSGGTSGAATGSSSSSGSSGSSGGPAGPPYALATSKADGPGPCYFNAQESPPDPLFLIVASNPISCEQTAPLGLNPGHCPVPGAVWEACFVIPQDTPDGVVSGFVGAEYFLAPPPTAGQFCCNGESNISDDGTITVSAIDGDHVSFTLSGTTQSDPCSESGPNILLATDGTYDVTRCP